MPSRIKLRNTGCPIAFALDMFGDRWSLLIIRDMLMREFQTYSQFLEGEEGIATNILADRLQALEELAIISKRRDPANRRRVLYSLTEKGADLAPVLLEMLRWSSKYDPNTFVKAQIVERIQSDREAFVDELRTKAVEKAQTSFSTKKQ